MNTKPLAIIACFVLLFTSIWLIIMISDIFTGKPPVETFDQAMAKLSSLGPRHYVMYTSTTLLTIFATMLMAGMFAYTRSDVPEWLGLVGLVFVPVYCAFNVVAYFSQVVTIPALLAVYEQPESKVLAALALRHMIQELPGSSIAILNSMAYAMFGIPSIIYGLGLRNHNTALRLGGLLLSLSGAASIFGLVGMLVEIPILGIGTILGGGLFFLGLFPLIAGWVLEK